MKKITEKTLINKLIKAHPEAAEILMAYGLQCINCHFSEFDSLEDAAKIHGLSDEDVKLMIKDVNEVLNHKPSHQNSTES